MGVGRERGRKERRGRWEGGEGKAYTSLDFMVL